MTAAENLTLIDATGENLPMWQLASQVQDHGLVAAIVFPMSVTLINNGNKNYKYITNTKNYISWDDIWPVIART